MAGAGYNIPISLSAATTLSVPTSLNAPTYFNFHSTGSRFGDARSEANPVQPATAVATAAQGDAASDVSGSGVGTAGGQNTVMIIAVAAVVIAAIIGAALYFRRR